MGHAEMEADARRAEEIKRNRVRQESNKLLPAEAQDDYVVFAGHKPVTTRHRTEYLDVDNQPFDTAEQAQMSSFWHHLATWVGGYFGAQAIPKDGVMRAIFAGRDELLAILTPLRDATADARAFRDLVEETGTLPPLVPKPYRERLVGEPEETEEPEDDTPEHERRQYTYADMKDAFNLGMARGVKPGPMPKGAW